MTITTNKGFKTDLTCHGFQFEIRKTFEHESPVEACASGFHACEYPLDYFSYYPPAESLYAETESTADISGDSDNIKTNTWYTLSDEGQFVKCQD